MEAVLMSVHFRSSCPHSALRSGVELGYRPFPRVPRASDHGGYRTHRLPG